MIQPQTPALKGAIFLALLLSLSFTEDINSQDVPASPSGAGVSPSPFLTAQAHYGFIMAHNPNMDYLIQRHIGAAELSLALQSKSEKKWERIYKNPEKGLSIYISDLGNPDQLGQAVGIFPFVNFPLNPGRRFKLFLRTGDGIGIITKPYDQATNNKNNINGSMLNAFIYQRLYAVFHIAKHTQLHAGAGITHLSNGNFAVPNLGINIMTVNLGLSFNKAVKTMPLITREVDTTGRNFSRKFFVTIVPGFGVNENNYRNGPKYGVGSLAVSVLKPVARKSRFTAGLDLFYDGSYLAKAKEKGTFDTSDKTNNLQAGARLGYEVVVGKFELPFEMGYYYRTKTTLNGFYYHRIGIRYYMENNIILSYTLRSHWFTAQNIELGVGYRF